MMWSLKNGPRFYSRNRSVFAGLLGIRRRLQQVGGDVNESILRNRLAGGGRFAYLSLDGLVESGGFIK